MRQVPLLSSFSVVADIADSTPFSNVTFSGISITVYGTGSDEVSNFELKGREDIGVGLGPWFWIVVVAQVVVNSLEAFGEENVIVGIEADGP